MRHRSSLVLFVLFLSGLGVLWWADRAKIKTRRELEDLLDRIVPELVDVQVPDVCRIEVTPGPGAERDRRPIVLERRPDTSWQLLQPMNAAADANLVDTLIRNLKDLRKSVEAGTITGDPTPYGLDKPTATLSVFATTEAGRDRPCRPVATLEIGKNEGRRLYVRPRDGSGIEVVDAVMLEPLTVPVNRWRDTAMMRVPSFQVASVDIRETEPARQITLQRSERSWRLVAPIQVPADDEKAEGLVAELTALRVADGTDGFVAADVPASELTKYGLDKPSLVLTVTPFSRRADQPAAVQSLRLGAAVPDKEGQYYALRGDQDDVVRVDAKRLREAIPGVNGFRSQKVLDINPARVTRLKIEARGQTYDLARTSKGWRMLSPFAERADGTAVTGLLKRLSELKASEFLDEKAVPNANLDPPNIRVRGWQAEAGKLNAETEDTAIPKEPVSSPRFDLAFGRADALRKTVFGRVAGDKTVLAMPDGILADLPTSAFTFRDRTVVSFSPQNVTRLTVERGPTRLTLEAPEKTGPINQWRIISPTEAKADTAAVTSLLVTLSNLRADSWEADHVGDGRAFGLLEPRLRVRWTLKTGPTAGAPSSSAAHENDGELLIGGMKPRSKSLYAQLGDDPRVFTLPQTVLVSLEQELRDKSIYLMRMEHLERVVFQWGDRTVTLNPYNRPGSRQIEWQTVLGYESDPIDIKQASEFIAVLCGLKTSRFLQYDGPLPAALDLAEDQARLVVKFKRIGESTMRTLRVGGSLAPHVYAATTAIGDSGPVFVFEAAAPWKSLLRPPSQPRDLPDDPFAPLPPGEAR